VPAHCAFGACSVTAARANASVRAQGTTVQNCAAAELPGSCQWCQSTNAPQHMEGSCRANQQYMQ
jgi:hypothetical protein